MEAIAHNHRGKSAQTETTATALTGIASLLQESWVWSVAILALDLAAWSLCCALDFYWRPGDVHIGFTPQLILLGIWPLATVLLALFVIGGYDRRTDMLSLTYMSEHLIGMAGALVLASLLIYCVASYNLPVKPGRGTLLLSFASFAPASLFYRRAICARTLSETARKYFLVIGTGKEAHSFFEAYMRSSNRQRLDFVDAVPPIFPNTVNARAVRATDSEILAQLNTLGPNNEGIIVATPVSQLSEALRDRLVRLHFQETRVYTLDTFYETYWRRIPVFALDPAWPLQLGFQLTRDSPYRHFKRICDIVGASVGLILLSPLIVVIALLTLWDSGRPVIFRQERVCRGGKRFTILKFRSMKNRPPGSEGDIYTRTNDSRITRLGKWLRKLRLDELPQLWNVLQGDMSLIGPRAEWVKCAELYERNIPSYHFRHLVKPGITGWAQVNYSYGENEEDALQKLKYDLYYIRRYSLRLDAMIVLKTLHIILLGKGQ